MLNRIEYATDLYKSDRELMTSYQNAVKKVEDWTMQLADEMDSLLALQDKYQTQQGELKTLMAKLEQHKEAYAQQLAEAQKQAQDYKKTISKQEAIIRAQEAAAARANANTYDGGGTGASGGIASDSYLKDPDCNPSQTTDVSGADIVAFAQQFVGNPYVWGGNSLTNGVDCSGFVHQVYAHFGISTPRYSQAFKSVGQPVSYQNIQAGDVVVYPGHVAIYIGNGNIVEAQSTRAGITNSRPVNCHTITAIRRVVEEFLMRPKHLVSIVLIAVVLVMLMRNNNSMTNARPLVYRESLDEVAAQINGETLTLRDMAFYVGYEEYQIQQEALVYDPDDPNRYWSMRVEGGFMNAVARKNAMQMALHDELFYQMAMEEGLTLDDNDQKHMDNKLEDFWEDLTERQGETALGISRKDAKKTIQRIAYAQKYQEVYAQLHNRTYDDYAYMEDSYQKLLKKQKYKVNAKVWNRVSLGNVTYNNKKKEDKKMSVKLGRNDP